MGLQAKGKIVEDTAEFDSTAAQLARTWNVLNALRDLVPGGVELVGRRIARSFDGHVAGGQWIQLENLAMTMEEINGELAWDEGGDGGDLHILCLFAQEARHGGRNVCATGAL